MKAIASIGASMRDKTIPYRMEASVESQFLAQKMKN